VHHAVAGLDVGCGDVAHTIAPVGDFQPPGGLDLEEAASQRSDGLAHGHIGACNPAAQHVVAQHGRQQGLVGQQCFFGHTQFAEQRGKGGIGGCKHGQRTGAQVLCQPGGDHGLYQDAEVGVALGDFDNVALGLVTAPAASLQQGGASAQRGGHQDGAAVQQSVHGCLQVK